MTRKKSAHAKFNDRKYIRDTLGDGFHPVKESPENRKKEDMILGKSMWR